jgi:hypothetical protein
VAIGAFNGYSRLTTQSHVAERPVEVDIE